jgi:ornithine decarboxylase
VSSPAVKCNPDPKVMALLAALGTGFDCASKWEIEQVLKMGLAPERIIYAQPCKTNSYVRFVKSVGVKQMTFDNTDELYKIAKLFPDAELFLRIMTDDESSLCRLSMKFGAPKDTTENLLALAHELGLNVVGVSFHVGSGASDAMAFWKAVKDAYDVFEEGRRHGFNMKTLDVGGGFCGDTFETMATVLNAALDKYFPAHSNINLIAEPGRYYVSTAFTIACNIIARRTVEYQPDVSMNGSQFSAIQPMAHATANSARTRYMLYINDGLYGNFSSIMFDHQHPVAKVLRANDRYVYDTPAASASTDGGVEYSVWGPTCDGIDRITESICFEDTLDVGDWLYFEEMGAYTKCSATRFNGFSDDHDVIYVCSEPGAMAILGI